MNPASDRPAVTHPVDTLPLVIPVSRLGYGTWIDPTLCLLAKAPLRVITPARFAVELPNPNVPTEALVNTDAATRVGTIVCILIPLSAY